MEEQVAVEKRLRYQPKAVWIEIATGDRLYLLRRDTEGLLWFEGRIVPLKEKEVIWSC